MLVTVCSVTRPVLAVWVGVISILVLVVGMGITLMRVHATDAPGTVISVLVRLAALGARLGILLIMWEGVVSVLSPVMASVVLLILLGVLAVRLATSL